MTGTPGALRRAYARALGVLVWILLGVSLIPVVVLAHAASAVLVTALRRRPLDDPDMADPGAIALTVALAVLLAVSLVVHTHREARRRREVLTWAAAHGWTTDVPASLLVGRWDAPPFDRAGQSATDVLERADPRGTVRSFTGSRLLRPRHVVMVERPMAGPGLLLTPEGSTERWARRLGGQDLTVEWEDFNARWRIRSHRGRFAHAVLHPRLMERLSRPDTDGLSVLVEGADVVVHTAGRTDLERVERLARVALDLVDLLPTFVQADHPPLPAGLNRRQVRERRASRWSKAPQ